MQDPEPSAQWFENWNRGMMPGSHEGDILDAKDSLCSVHGAHMALQEYQAAFL